MLTSVWPVALRCLTYVVVVLLSHEIACRTGVFESCYIDYSSIGPLAFILSVGALATELVMVPILRFLKGVSLTRPWVVIFFYGLAGFPIGAFCCFLGARFALQLHNKYGSLLSPLGWIALGIVFAVIASWAAFTTLATGDYSDLRAVIGAAFLAVCCFVNAFNVRACQCRPESRVQRGPDAP